MNGVVSGFQPHYTSTYELENCLWVELTSDKEWNPHSSEFTERERVAGEEINTITSPDRNICSIQTTHNEQYISQNLYGNILQHVYINSANSTNR
jgi:hypothetical protein